MAVSMENVTPLNLGSFLFGLLLGRLVFLRLALELSDGDESDDEDDEVVEDVVETADKVGEGIRGVGVSSSSSSS